MLIILSVVSIFLQNLYFSSGFAVVHSLVSYVKNVEIKQTPTLIAFIRMLLTLITAVSALTCSGNSW